VCRSDLGVLEPLFNPPGHSLAAHAEGTSKSAQARAFLVGIENGLFFLVVVGVGSSIFAVLFATGFALVALPAVGCEAVLEEVVALAVRAGECNCDWHQGSILT
jgi:hypothetical protein